jgi:NAD(P)-dependent dehydrogenase (short-subunit alcohol dehydrogenase family)
MHRNKTVAGQRVLDQKIALISGGASGIGRAIGELFASQGAAVAFVDMDVENGEKVSKAIREGGGRAIFIPGDVTDPGICRRAVEEVCAAYGGLDILINNAGIIRRATVLETSEGDWDRMMAVNVKAVFLLSKFAIPAMIDRQGGAIVNIASGWGLVGGERAAAYCASKGAVVQLTKAMAIDHGPQKIRVNCLCPGDTDTPMLSAEAEQLGIPRDHFTSAAALRPLGRLGQPADIAQAALFLASETAGFVTGTTLVVDGGGLAG